MTVKEFAQVCGKAECTVRRYCRNGWIQDAAKVGGKWVIPEDARLPYISKKRKFSGACEKRDYVLKAIESEKFLDYRLLALSREEFDSIARKLQEEGQLRAGERGYELTRTGMDHCNGLHQRQRQEKKDTVSVAVSLAGLGAQILLN